jgi:hypothetical protein
MRSGAPHFLYYIVKTFFVDGPDGFRRQLQGNPFIFFGEEEALGLEVREEPALCLDIGVGNLVPGYRLLARHLTYSGHDRNYFGSAKVVIST